MPKDQAVVQGLEPRLAQVFVNRMINAISFCEDGYAVCVVVVVKDAGPGIPGAVLTKIFKRFCAQRPAEHSGSNSGLRPAIPKRIMEARDGMIRARTLCPLEADAAFEALDVRFVAGAPV